MIQDFSDNGATHRITVVFEMEEMTGSPEESAEVLMDLYVANEVTVISVHAYEMEKI